MNLLTLKICWNWIKKLHPEVLRIICFILLILLICSYTTLEVKDIFNNYENQELIQKLNREAYTIKIAPIVNEHIEDIILKDVNATNVILLNYHNSLVSSHGLSYRYLTAICELFKGLKSKPCVEYWKELDYINYSDEIQKINTSNHVILSNLSEIREDFPKFTYLLERSGFKSAAVFPIVGIRGSVGMLIIGYSNEVTEVDTEYMRTVIIPNIQPLSTLLDYEYVNEK